MGPSRIDPSRPGTRKPAWAMRERETEIPKTDATYHPR
jgi:hypothetical protein